MAIEDLKRWHWVVIGVVVGALMGLGQVYGGNEPWANLPSIGQQEFEEGLRARPRDGAAVFENITVYPGAGGEPDLVVVDRRMDWGLFAGLRAGPAGSDARQIRYVQHFIRARRPFKPFAPIAGAVARPNYTVRDYLNDAHVNFRYAWWKEPKTLIALWTVGSTVLIGGVWPTVLNLLVGAGFGRRQPKEPDYDLGRFKSEPGPAGPAATTPDGAALEEHVRKLEEELAGSLSAGVSAAGQDQANESKPAPALLAAPVEAPAAAGDEDKEYQGEFYPVARPHHQETQHHPPGAP
jgi:hypothetical protein